MSSLWFFSIIHQNLRFNLSEKIQQSYYYIYNILCVYYYIYYLLLVALIIGWNLISGIEIL